MWERAACVRLIVCMRVRVCESTYLYVCACVYVRQSYGEQYEAAASAELVAPFIANFHIDMADVIMPDGGWACFNDFFYRRS